MRVEYLLRVGVLTPERKIDRGKLGSDWGVEFVEGVGKKYPPLGLLYSRPLTMW